MKLLQFISFYFLIISVNGNKKGKSTAAEGGGSSGGSGGDGGKIAKIEEALYTKYRDQVCNAVPAFKGQAGGKNVTFYDVITEDEVYELAFLNLAYGLTTDAISHLPVDMGYKKRVMDLISIVTKISCDNSVVSVGFSGIVEGITRFYVSL